MLGSRFGQLSLMAVLLTACEPYPGTGTSTSSSGGTSASSSSSSSGSSSGREPIDSQKLCDRIVTECKQATTVAECKKQYAAILVTTSCASALASASCAELTSSSSAVFNGCFPRCTGKIASCNADGSITKCTALGTTTVFDCASACVADGLGSYSGTCGASFNGQVAEQPQCWCE